MAFETPTNGVAYTGKKFDELGIKYNESLTSVIEKIIDAHTKALSAKKLLMKRLLLSVSDSGIVLDSAVTTRPKGLWDGTVLFLYKRVVLPILPLLMFPILLIVLTTVLYLFLLKYMA